MKRIDCLKAIYPQLEDCAVVTIMGAVAAELYSLGHRANFFYLEHAMGLASSIGLGIALSQPQCKVVVIDGDGSVLMNLGGLTTMARSRPKNLVHMIFDNETLSRQQPLSQALRNIPQTLLKYGVESLVSQMPPQSRLLEKRLRLPIRFLREPTST